MWRLLPQGRTKNGDKIVVLQKKRHHDYENGHSRFDQD
jgi:hypothetical protein